MTTPVPPPALELADVVKRYGADTTEVRALTDVSLSVEPGEFVAVMGSSSPAARCRSTSAGAPSASWSPLVSALAD